MITIPSDPPYIHLHIHTDGDVRVVVVGSLRKIIPTVLTLTIQSSRLKFL
jgi:hypothetical protein